MLTELLLTLLTGGVGYLIVYYFWEPIRQINYQKKEINVLITKFANVRKISKMKKNKNYTGPYELYEEIVLNKNQIEKTINTLRDMSGRLRSIINTELLYSFLSKIRLVPNKSKIEKVSTHLIGWSNSFGLDDESKSIGNYINLIVKELNIPTY